MRERDDRPRPDRVQLVNRQTKLRQKYMENWDELIRWRDNLDPQRHVANPHLMSITAHNYADAEVRIMVVGQQTNGWEHEKKRCTVDDLLKVYEDFQIGQRYMGDDFWKAAHKLYELLNPRGRQNGFLWTNLNKVEENNGPPRRDLRDKVRKLFNVLPTEIELAQPDAVVFFTGTERPESVFTDVTRESTRFRDVTKIARLVSKSEQLPRRSFWTFQPLGLRLQGLGVAAVVEEIAELIKKD